jgi:hypothetical protein
VFTADADPFGRIEYAEPDAALLVVRPPQGVEGVLAFTQVVDDNAGVEQSLWRARDRRDRGRRGTRPHVDLEHLLA